LRLLFYILNNPELLDEVLEVFLEMGLKGATVVDSVGMGRILAQDVPIFAGLRLFLPSSTPGNKTILTLVPEDIVDELIKEIERVCDSPLDQPGTGIAFTVPVDKVYGLAKMELE
jgi:nitrogen regulatory protein PII